MKDNNNNHTNVILNLFQDSPKDKMLNQVQHDNTVVVPNDATTCPPLEALAEPAKNEPSETACRMAERPKFLISRRGKNALVCNQEPSPEFVSSSQLTNKFYPLTKREGRKT